MLQFIAVRCSVLHLVAVCCSVLQCVALFCILSHCVTGWQRPIGSPKLQIIFPKRATKYRALLRKMTYKDKGSYESSPPCTRISQGLIACTCSALQHRSVRYSGLQCVAVCCSVLQCVAVCCSVMRCVALYCNVLHCVALCCIVLHCVAVC